MSEQRVIRILIFTIFTMAAAIFITVQVIGIIEYDRSEALINLALFGIFTISCASAYKGVQDRNALAGSAGAAGILLVLVIMMKEGLGPSAGFSKEYLLTAAFILAVFGLVRVVSSERKRG